MLAAIAYKVWFPYRIAVAVLHYRTIQCKNPSSWNLAIALRCYYKDLLLLQRSAMDCSKCIAGVNRVTACKACDGIWKPGLAANKKSGQH